MTTSEKSCVSEVTRLTILPEGCSSKNDRSWRMVAAKTSSRSFSTTSPTTRAANHCWTKLKTQASTPSSSTPRDQRAAWPQRRAGPRDQVDAASR